MRETWDEDYRQGALPWDTGEPDDLLVRPVTAGRIRPGRTLEIGCGTGTNAIWLSEQGFQVLGVDIAPHAIAMAEAKSAPKDSVEFRVLDFMNAELADGPFDFVFDRGTFHIFDAHDERLRFAERVAQALAPGGHWLSLIGSTEGPARDHGPPRRSARDIVAAIEPALEIEELYSSQFNADIPSPAKAWACLSRRRDPPAQLGQH